MPSPAIHHRFIAIAGYLGAVRLHDERAGIRSSLMSSF
jgi:hypothetical protein